MWHYLSAHRSIANLLVIVIWAVICDPSQDASRLVHQSHLLQGPHLLLALTGIEAIRTNVTCPALLDGPLLQRKQKIGNCATLGGALCGLPSVTSLSMPSVPYPCASQQHTRFTGRGLAVSSVTTPFASWHKSQITCGSPTSRYTRASQPPAECASRVIGPSVACFAASTAALTRSKYLQRAAPRSAGFAQ